MQSLGSESGNSFTVLWNGNHSISKTIFIAMLVFLLENLLLSLPPHVHLHFFYAFIVAMHNLFVANLPQLQCTYKVPFNRETNDRKRKRERGKEVKI